MKASLALTLIFFLSVLSAFSYNPLGNVLNGNNKTESPLEFKYNRDQGFNLAVNDRNFYSFNWAVKDKSDRNLIHDNIDDNKIMKVIDAYSILQNYKLDQLHMDSFKPSNGNIYAFLQIFDNDKMRTFPKYLNVNLDFYNVEEEQANISIDSNVVKDIHPEYQPIDYSKEIPGHVPNGVTFLSVDLMKGKTWIHKMEIKE